MEVDLGVEMAEQDHWSSTPRCERDMVAPQHSSQWLLIVSFLSLLSVLLFPTTDHQSTRVVAFEDDEDEDDDDHGGVAVPEMMTMTCCLTFYSSRWVLLQIEQDLDRSTMYEYYTTGDHN
jgi:hypothetical protein